jgi:hypothetical protein
MQESSQRITWRVDGREIRSSFSFGMARPFPLLSTIVSKPESFSNSSVSRVGTLSP